MLGGVLGGVLGAGAIVTSFYAIAMLPIADWVAISFLVPLFVAGLSGPMLGAPASVIAPFDYTGLLWALAVGWLVWNETPDANLMVGGVLVIGSGLYVVMSAARRAPR